VNQKRLELSVDHMLFYLGDVVGHIVYDMHIQRVGSGVELFRESLSS
jgi:hypothetical protein